MTSEPETEGAEQRTFDVALSFSGADRAHARKIAEALRENGFTVFYDEWFKADLWGRDLGTYLRDIYLKARFCIPIISRNYVQGRYPQHEFAVLRERLLLENAGNILPVRLDDSEAPGLSRLIATIDYRIEGPLGIALLVRKRWQGIRGSSQDRPQIGIIQPSNDPLKSHHRRPAKASFTVRDARLATLINDRNQYGSADMRARLASEFVRYLNWKHDASLGIPYGAWMADGRLLVSTLPSLHSPQRTLEFSYDSDSGELGLASEWSSDDPRYGKFQYWEWQPAVKGLTADPSGINLDREVAILIHEKMAAEFGCPIVPTGTRAEKLCGWLHEDPPTDYLDWGRDPRLVPDGFGCWDAVEHTPTGVGMLVFTLHGRWSAPAFLALVEGMRILLPTRHRLDVISQGAVRVSVCLSVNPTHRNHLSSGDNSNAKRALHRTYSILARMVAAGRQWPLAAPDKAASVPALSELNDLFSAASEALGNAEYPAVVDHSDRGFYEAEWIKLRQSDNAGKVLGMRSTPLPFNYGDVVTTDEIHEYINKYERE